MPSNKIVFDNYIRSTLISTYTLLVASVRCSVCNSIKVKFMYSTGR